MCQVNNNILYNRYFKIGENAAKFEYILEILGILTDKLGLQLYAE